MVHMTDSRFSRSLNDGSDSGFAELVRRYERRLLTRVIARMGRRFASVEDPEDPVQSILRLTAAAVRQKRYSFRHVNEVTALLRKITDHVVIKHIDHLLAAKRGWLRRETREVSQCVSPDPSPADVVAACEQVEKVVAAITSGLDAVHLEVFALRMKGLTRAEIAIALGSTEGAVRVKLDRIRYRMNRWLDSPHPMSDRRKQRPIRA